MISLKVQSKALQMLKREVVFRGSAKGAFRSIGNDVTPQIINDCYDRMGEDSDRGFALRMAHLRSCPCLLSLPAQAPVGPS